jgi:hypothetical protein
MSNSLDVQITEEGPRNAVVKLTGILDTSDISEIPAIEILDFVNNDQQLYLKGFRVDLIEWSMSKDLEIQLMWHSNTPEQIFPIAGRGRIYATNYGGFLPDESRVGYNGSIDLITNGFVAGQIANFTVILELVKLYRVN